MAKNPWLPVDFTLSEGSTVKDVLFEGHEWQIMSLSEGNTSLLVTKGLLEKWFASELVSEGIFEEFNFGQRKLAFASSRQSQTLRPVTAASVIRSKPVALSFAIALSETRRFEKNSGLQDAIYFERISRLLPTYSISARVPDEIILGYWLTGGMSISATSIRRLDQSMAWMSLTEIGDVVRVAGFHPSEIARNEEKREYVSSGNADERLNENSPLSPKHTSNDVFDLPGRPDLSAFFNEHIVDIIRHKDRYRSLGIEFPSAVILHGPPGCGKTFAVEKLIEFLGWPSYQIEASSVASPYIHETSKKVAEVFQLSIDNAHSVLVIDEMEAFLADRSDRGIGHHHVEEVAEFLRRIPEAASKGVLIVAMTNRIDMIDPAIQRRGRFDHVIKVDFANEIEIVALMNKLLESLPTSSDLDVRPMAKKLSGRPLSDVSFVVREAARLSARAGATEIGQDQLLRALHQTPVRTSNNGEQERTIGFV